MIRVATNSSRYYLSRLPFFFSAILIFLGTSISDLIADSKAAAAAADPAQAMLDSSNVPDNHGPHAGYVNGSGEILAEIVPEASGNLRVYFLDANWNELATEGFIAKVSVKPTKGKEYELTCKAVFGSYSCEMPQATKLAAGDQVTVSREQAPVKPVKITYLFPFKHR